MIPRHPFFRLLTIALPLAAILLLMACTPSHNQSTFDPAGPVADKQLDLFLIIFWAAVGVFIVVGGMLLYVVIRFRRRRGQDQIPAQTHGNASLEIGWTVAPTVLVGVIAGFTIFFVFDINSPPSGVEALEVNVIGHQWWWEFEYPEQKVITANELHAPVDRPVKLNLMSDDVIHSFWVPKLAGKVDVVPTNVNTMWFTARKSDVDTDVWPAEFYGQCAEFCGVSHANMRFRVFVEESQEAFDGWVENYHRLATRPPPAGDTEEAKGATLFASRGCLLCHTTSGPASAEVRQSLKEAFERGELRFPAPNLTNFGSRKTMAAGITDLNRDSVIKWLHDPNDFKPGNRMAELANVYRDPNARLTEEDISALAAYLLNLK